MRERLLQPELMDNPALPPHRHDPALRGLARLNTLSNAAGALHAAMADLLADASPGQPLRVLDLATGGGDIPLRLAQRAPGRLTIHGCDISPHAIHRANAAAARRNLPAHFFTCDLLHDPLPAGYDVLTCSLFIHHLTTDDARQLLHRMAAAARRRVLVLDLHRSRLNHALVAAAARLVSRSPIVHADGPRSVRAAFTADELTQLARQAGLAGATVKKRFPCRLLLTWSRP